MSIFDLVQDGVREVRQASRALLRAPGHAAVVVSLLGLGIGANAAMFTLVNAIFLRDLPVEQPERLVTLSPGWPTELFQEFRGLPKSFAGIFAAGSLGGADGANGRVATANYFDVLGVKASMGRVFHKEDEHNPVVVISHAFWQKQFGGAPDVLQRSVRIGSQPFRIIGVAPRQFTGDAPGLARDFWVPLQAALTTTPATESRKRPNYPWLSVMARLGPQVSLAQAREEATAIYGRMSKTRLRVESASRGFGGVRGLEGPLQILAGTVAVVLLVIWANVATLLLARGATRVREMAVRQALGGSRWRLLRQVLLEGLLLAAAGGAIGLAIAPGAARALLLMRPSFERIDLDLSPDPNVLLFGVGVTILTAIAFSIAPALRASHREISAALKSGPSGSSGRRRTVRVVIAVQVALSAVLVASSFLFTRSLIRLNTLDVGYDRDHLLSVTLNLGLAGYRDGAEQVRVGQRIADRIAAMPGVKSVGVGLCAVLMGCSRSAEGDPTVWLNPVSPNYLETAGIPIVAGRGFGPEDRAGSPRVAVVTEAFARYRFPGESPLGKSFEDRNEAAEIVGVARDVRFVSPRDAPIRMVFFSQAQVPSGVSYVQVRTTGSPEAMTAAVRKAILDVEPRVSLLGPDPLNATMTRMLSRDVLLGRASGLFGGIALVLACFGVYGVISYLVAAQASDYGIRLALGAPPVVVLRHIIAGAIWTVLPGIGVGIAGAWAASRWIESLLFGIAARDVVTYAGVAVCLVAATVLAASLPALRASRMDPLSVLREG
jgi:predicted permease